MSNPAMGAIAGADWPQRLDGNISYARDPGAAAAAAEPAEEARNL